MANVSGTSAEGTPTGRGFARYNSSYRDTSGLSLGCREIGKVKVDCCFLGSKSVWGELSDRSASLMYIDLTFHQPEDCKLTNATITLTMEYEKRVRPSPDCLGPRVTEFFGPKEINGEKQEQHVTDSFEFKPNIGAMGYSFGGVGGERKSQYSTSSRWRFRGQRWPVISKEPGDNEGGTYRQLEWVLEESSVKDQAFHSGQMHTGLVIEHDRIPFNVEVEIKGKLRRSLKRLRFPPLMNSSKKKTSIALKIDVNVPLDDLAAELNRAMTEKNLQPVPGKLTYTQWVKDFGDLHRALEKASSKLSTGEKDLRATEAANGARQGGTKRTSASHGILRPSNSVTIEELSTAMNQYITRNDNSSARAAVPTSQLRNKSYQRVKKPSSNMRTEPSLVHSQAQAKSVNVAVQSSIKIIYISISLISISAFNLFKSFGIVLQSMGVPTSRINDRADVMED